MAAGEPAKNPNAFPLFAPNAFSRTSPALAEYAKREDRIGRIQLLHKRHDAAGQSKFKRLDLTDIAVRDKVLRANSSDDLDNIFATDGFFE